VKRWAFVLVLALTLLLPGVGQAGVANEITTREALMADFSLQALHDEIENDPAGLGYKEVGGAWKDDAVIAGLINAANYKVDRAEVEVKQVGATITYAAYNDLAIDEQEFYGLQTRSEFWIVNADMKTLLTGRSLAADGIAGTGNDTQSWWSVAERSEMAPAFLALIEIDGSRAEVLWGEGKVVSISEVAHAANL
jgi:hypothetical protein